MLVTPLPIVTEVKPVQPLKAEVPMLLTLSGIVTLVNLVIPLQRPAGILSTAFPNVNEVIVAVKLLKGMEEQFFAFQTTEVKPVHSEKALTPMLVTLLGMVMLVSLFMPLQIYPGIFCTLPPKVNERIFSLTAVNGALGPSIAFQTTDSRLLQSRKTFVPQPVLVMPSPMDTAAILVHWEKA